MGTTNIVGLTDPTFYLIVVDFRYDPLTTIIHEVLHELYQDAPEKDIVAMERLVMKHLTETQATKVWAYATNCMRVT